MRLRVTIDIELPDSAPVAQQDVRELTSGAVLVAFRDPAGYPLPGKVRRIDICQVVNAPPGFSLPQIRPWEPEPPYK